FVAGSFGAGFLLDAVAASDLIWLVVAAMAAAAAGARALGPLAPRAARAARTTVPAATRPLPGWGFPPLGAGGGPPHARHPGPYRPAIGTRWASAAGRSPRFGRSG